MWYGTSDGLYRYDGYTHQVFTYNEDDSTTLSDNFIFSLFEDSNRSIWIGTLHGGVSLYDPITNSFQRCFGSDSVMRGSQVNDIAEDHAGNIWIASSRGLHRFDGTKLSHIYLSRKAAINGYRSHIRSLHIDALGIIWLGGYASSLGKYDPETNQFEHFQDLFIEKSYIRKIAEDDAGNLWMASFQGGLIRLNKKSRSFNRWTSMDIGNKPGIVVGSIAMSDDRIFMATSIGLCVYNLQTQKFENEEFGPNGIYKVPSEYMLSIYKEEDKRIWLGTTEMGIHVLPLIPSLRTYNHPLPGNRLSNVWHGKRKSIYANNNYGLLVVDSLENSTQYIPAAEQSARVKLSGNFVSSVTEDWEGNLWIGTESGLNHFNHLTKKIEVYIHSPSDTNSLMGSRVPRTFVDSRGELWALAGPGWNHFDAKAKQFVRGRKKGGSGNSIDKIGETRAGMWIGSTDGGLALLHVESGLLDYFVNDPKDKHSLSNNYVTELYADSRDVLWVGTNTGLNQLQGNNAFRRYGKIHGLKQESIRRIEEDKDKNLLVQTGDGIYRLHRNDHDGSGNDTLFHEIYGPRSLTPDDGIFHYPYYTWSEGNFVADILIDELKPDTLPPPVVITNFHLDPNNKNPLDAVNLKMNPTYRKSISLDYDQNLFSIEFSALDFANPEKNQYAYKLDGFDADWTQSETRRFVTYTNIDPGTYTFRVKGSNSQGVWNEQGASLSIVINPPFWKTWWAYTGYGMAFIGLLLAARRITVNRERLKAQVLVEQKEKQALRELDHLKTTFFSSITHEFRTPLTLIQGPADELLEKTNDPGAKHLIGLIKSNSHRLLKLINQLLDLARLDAGEMRLKLRDTNLATFFTARISQFTSLADSRRIDFAWKLQEVLPTAVVDEEKLETIVTNLISNALKFTPEKGNVNVSVTWENGMLQLEVADTGRGIPPDKLKHIFDRFYQVEPSDSTHSEGTGIGLALVKEYVEVMKGKIQVESAQGKGTRFVVMIPAPVSSMPSAPDAVTSDKKVEYPQSENGHPEDAQLPLLLLTEDNEDIRSFIKVCLGQRFRYLEARHGREGLELAMEQMPDLILSDLMMPEMDGMEFCARIKSDRRTDHIPFIMLTAKAAEESKLEGLKTGADDYLVKPFNKAELLLKVQNLITLRTNLQNHIRTAILAQASDVQATSAEEQFVLKARLFVEAHLKDETLSVETLAGEMNLSREQCYRKISALSGLAPSAFIRKIKLQQANQLLTSKWGPVSQVTYEAGFENLSYFSKAFKEEFGKLPSEV